MSFILEFSEIALADIKKHKKSGDKTVLKKIEKLLNELMIHSTNGIGQPEELKHNFKGWYSRRINQKHRIIYSINEDVGTVSVLSAWSHYGDKYGLLEKNK